MIFQTLKIVHHSPEFLPYVIFLSAPSPACLKQLGSNNKNEADYDLLSSVSNFFLYNWFSINLKELSLQVYIFIFKEDEIQNALEESRRIREEYQQYFDLEITVDDFENSFRTIMEAIVKLQNESQWVPLNWVYSWYPKLIIKHPTYR